jgi:hypothetical protein
LKVKLWTSDSGAALDLTGSQRWLLLNDNREFVHGWMRILGCPSIGYIMRKNYATGKTNALINKARKQRLGLACKFIQLWWYWTEFKRRPFFLAQVVIEWERQQMQRKWYHTKISLTCHLSKLQMNSQLELELSDRN